MSFPVSERPGPLMPVAELMSSYPGDWLICGGWAVDAWLGRVTRTHVDIDVMLFHDEQTMAYNQFSSWDMVAHDAVDPGPTTELWAGRRLELPAHVHARPRDATSPANLLKWVTPPYDQLPDDKNVELIINERRDGSWLLHPESGVSRPWPECVAQSPWELPTAVPEVLLFYKATAYWRRTDLKPRPHDERDFDALLPQLDAGQRDWLIRAISTVVRNHPWLERLG